MRWSQAVPAEIRPQVSVILRPWFGRVLRDAGMEEHCVEALMQSLHVQTIGTLQMKSSQECYEVAVIAGAIVVTAS